MKQSTMDAYAEVDSILELMDSKYIMEIPKQLRQMFKDKKAINYNKKIVANKPLQEQELSSETLEILAVLNYNYWCKDEVKKKELLDLYYKNDLKKEKESREKYNPDNIFKNKNIVNKPEENVSMVVIEEKSVLKKIINFIKRIFNK